MIKEIIIVALLTFIANCCSSQIKDHVVDNTVPIKSADINDTLYNDLLPLQQAIGNKRIVMLGEIYHGDGETFKLKSRIVRFLHEQMGFNVLVFESDFFALNQGYEFYKAGQILYDSLVYLSVFPVWTRCAQARALFYYTRESTERMHGQELVISGMDNRGFSAYFIRYFSRKLDSILRQAGIPFVQASSYSFFIDKIDAGWAAEKDKTTLDSLVALLPVVIEELRAKQSQSHDPGIEYYILVLRGLLDNYKMFLHYRHSNEYKVHKKDYPHHDLGMAENLNWLANNKFPGEKIIVWAHNTHVEKREGNLSYAKYKSMGQYFIEDSLLAKQTYILGTTCFTGSGKIIGLKTVEKAANPEKNSLESWMHSKNYQYGFVDFSSIIDKESIAPFYMKTYLTSTYKQNWTKMYDGILYVHEAKPCIEQEFTKQ
jgi:erythromycin esterase